METKDVVATQDTSPAAMMAQALAAGQDLEKLEQLLNLQIRYEENEAKKAYHKAMATFKANPPDINKDKQVSYHAKGGTTSYKHASLHNVCDKINKALSQHGLSAAWKTNQGEGGVTVTCTITHEMGHSESTSLTAGADNSGSKNSIQAIGSTITYLERYTLLALTGLATKEDDDGRASEPVEYIGGATLDGIKALLKEVGVSFDDKNFLRTADAEAIDKIPAANAERISSLLRRKKAQMQTREPGEEG